MAVKAIEAGIRKVALDAPSTFMLAILAGVAGAFIAMEAVFATTVMAGTSGIPYSVDGGARPALCQIVGGLEIIDIQETQEMRSMLAQAFGKAMINAIESKFLNAKRQ